MESKNNLVERVTSVEVPVCKSREGGLHFSKAKDVRIAS